MEKTNYSRKAKCSDKIQKMVDGWVKERNYLISGIKIEDLARKLGINRTYVSNYINDTYNANFNGWINSLRIKDAQTLMKENIDLTVGQIAYMTGYSDITHFSKLFKKYAGMTPTKWKKECLKQ